MDILFQDKFFVAINKPSGLLVHRSDIDRHETRFAMQMVRDFMRQRVYPLHRLDKPTSGVLLFALDQKIAGSMMRMFVANQIAKSYLAVVRGYTEESGVIDYSLVEQWDKMIVRNVNQTNTAQQAVTKYQRLATVELDYPVGRYNSARYSLVHLRPQTGRRHQIRRHMKHLFHPIVGDTTHGDGKHNQFFRNQFNVHRLLLHAYSMSFIHPETKENTVIKAGLDESFLLVARELGWDNVLPTNDDALN